MIQWHPEEAAEVPWEMPREPPGNRRTKQSPKVIKGIPRGNGHTSGHIMKTFIFTTLLTCSDGLRKASTSIPAGPGEQHGTKYPDRGVLRTDVCVYIDIYGASFDLVTTL